MYIYIQYVYVYAFVYVYAILCMNTCVCIYVYVYMYIYKIPKGSQLHWKAQVEMSRICSVEIFFNLHWQFGPSHAACCIAGVALATAGCQLVSILQCYDFARRVQAAKPLLLQQPSLELQCQAFCRRRPFTETRSTLAFSTSWSVPDRLSPSACRMFWCRLRNRTRRAVSLLVCDP